MSDIQKSSQVPGQFLGYSLQTTECLRQLMCAAPGVRVSVEAFEDVGVEDPSGAQAYIQTKSALNSNPVSDSSTEWWKAIASWTKLSSEQGTSAKRIFNVHVFSPKNAPLASSFSNATDVASALKALDECRLKFWGDAPTFSKKAELSASIASYVNTLLEADPDTAAYVIENFRLTFGSGCSREDLKSLPAAKFIPPECLDDVLDKSLGWVKATIEKSIEDGEVPAIDADVFTKEMNAFIKRISFVKILADYAGEPSADDVAKNSLKNYVKQLRIIEADDEEILRAINSYLRAATNRSAWSERLLVHEDSFTDFEKALKTYWLNTKKQQDLDHSQEEGIKRGVRLLLGCMSHRPKLEGQSVPDDFTPGSFHDLADSELLGWHPDYKNELKKGMGNGTSGS